MAVVVYIGLGSNIGDGLHTLQKAWQEIGRIEGVELQILSSPYKSEPVGMDSDNWFINAVGRISVECGPYELLDMLHVVEKKFGRKRNPDTSGYQDRILDLDILLFGDIIEDGSKLKVPHPQLHKRRFVLDPFVEIDAEALHPGFGRTIRDVHRQLMADMQSGTLEPQQLSRTVWP